jgi:thiosulfate dehydrogenase [quinone] large subunit
MRDKLVTRRGEVVQDAPFVKMLLGNPAAGWVWLLPRLWLGYQWINASSHKISNPAWMRTGEALKSFWVGAVAIPKTGHPPVSFDWYREFLRFLLDAQAYTWFARLIAIGELAVGIGLILGAFAGIAALFGGFMNWNFMMAGSAGVNPMLFLLAVALTVSWKVCGHVGADFWLLRRIGTPWRNPRIDPDEPAAKEKEPATTRWGLQES